VQLAEPLLVSKDADAAKALAALTADSDAHVRTQLVLANHAAGVNQPEALTATPNPIITPLLDNLNAGKNAAALGESARQGKQIYETLCTTCHGPDGKGVQQGDKLLAPAFTKSPWFAGTGNVNALARIILKGQTGPIAGVTYGEGLMLPLEGTYNDEQIASVINFIGQSWHKWRKPVAAADIAAVRKATADRKTPWTHEELLETVKK
jgi:mono/diheme cytochrome c family protein